MLANYPIALVLSTLLVAVAAPAAQLTVGAGSSIDLGSSQLDLGCADLTVAGSLSLSTGTIEGARDVSGAGVLAAGLGVLRLAGDWLPNSSFSTSLATVEFVDGCGRTAATILGDNSFATLRLLTTTSKLFAFEAARTQTIRTSLDIEGASGAPATVRSTSSGTAAIFDFEPGGLGLAQAVDVDDNFVVNGYVIADDGSTIGSNTSEWIFAAVAPALPAAASWLAPIGIVALAGCLLGLRARPRARAVSVRQD